MHPDFDAVLLAGGRASRLGGDDKTALVHRGSSLLDQAVGAASGARDLVVVGLREGSAAPATAILAREEPRWSGPVAAIAAGLDAVGKPPAAWTLVLACDLPRAPEAVAALWAGGGASLVGGGAVDEGASVDGLIAIDDEGRRQPLLALYRTSGLDDRIRTLAQDGALDGLSVRRLLAPLELLEVPVASGLCADVDTPDDLERLGVDWPRSRSTD